MSSIAPGELKPLLTAGGEIAFIDVREDGQFGEGHPFFAINIPYSRLELRAERLVPRKTAPIVLMDDGDGVSQMAARRLAGLGYADVRIMEGGAPGWAAAGYTLYKGVNLPSKTFGELVEEAAHTPHLTAADLHAMRERGESFVLLDGRTPREYRRMTIPGSRSCPNAEIGHRLPAILPDAKTPVIVNCAGRTRSIIGAQGLINQGLENPVYALENGTQGWTLAGFELECGTEPQKPAELDAAALAASRAKGEALIDKFGIATCALEDLRRWQEDGARTLYLLDVRTLEEFEAGHIPGAVHAPGGQLVQATDQWVAVRGARVVLADDTGLRTANTALWLARMGHDVHVLKADVTKLADLERGANADSPVAPALETCGPGALAERLAKGGILVDLRPSMDFRVGHIAGARWWIRPRLGRVGLDGDMDIILAADKRGVAELAAIDLAEHGCGNLSFLTGGLEDWRDAGLEIVATPDAPPDADCIDYLFFVHDRHQGNPEAARGYLEWETGLVAQLDDQERGIFTLDF
jgi:rhodanese-related sulfurtransferase